MKPLKTYYVKNDEKDAVWKYADINRDLKSLKINSTIFQVFYMFVFYHWMDYFCFVCVCFFLMWNEFLSEKIALNQKISLKMKFTCKTVNEIVHQLCFLLSKVWEILFPPSLLLDLRLLSLVLVSWLLLSVFLTNKNCIELATRRKISNLSAKLFA